MVLIVMYFITLHVNYAHRGDNAYTTLTVRFCKLTPRPFFAIVAANLGNQCRLNTIALSGISKSNQAIKTCNGVVSKIIVITDDTALLNFYVLALSLAAGSHEFRDDWLGSACVLPSRGGYCVDWDLPSCAGNRKIIECNWGIL